MFVNGSGPNEQIYRGPSIDASYNVSVHLAKGFQRRRSKCEKLTDDRRRTPSDGKSSRCLWQGELKKQRQCHLGCHFGKVTRTKLILTTQCFHMHLKFHCKSTKGSVTCDFYRSGFQLFDSSDWWNQIVIIVKTTSDWSIKILYPILSWLLFAACNGTEDSGLSD